MYSIYVDGQLLYNTAVTEDDKIILSPKLSLDVNAAGSLTFVLPPGNWMHGSIQKMKSIITVQQDGETIFRGRVLDDEKDFYNQKNVYCEGDRAFLMDSVQRPYEFSGKVRDLFKRYITNHNAMVDASRQFTVGTVDAVSETETLTISNKVFSSTSGEIENKLLGAYGGYIRTRTVGSITYIDWVKKYGSTSQQVIEFAVNLLDLKDKVDAANVFTVLIPLGKTELNDDGEYGDPLNIASVNGGKDYIENAAGIALFGKIWRSRTWGQEDNANKLMEKGRKHLETGIAINTITLKAIDWHFVDPNTERVKLGDDVRILTNPHGLDKTTICAKMDIDLHNPDKTDYTFGDPPKTLTDNIQDIDEEVGGLTGGGGGGKKPIQEEVKDIIRWAKVNVDELNANIQLTTGELQKTAQRLSAAELQLDGVNATATLAASRVDELAEGLDEFEGLVTSALLTLDGVTAQIELKVDYDGVISAINMSPENIKIKSKWIDLEGYVTISDLRAEIADINLSLANTVSTDTLRANSAIISFMTYAEKYCTWKSKTVQTSIPEFTKATITDANGNSRTVVTGWAEAPSAYRSTMNYLSY